MKFKNATLIIGGQVFQAQDLEVTYCPRYTGPMVKVDFGNETLIGPADWVAEQIWGKA